MPHRMKRENHIMPESFVNPLHTCFSCAAPSKFTKFAVQSGGGKNRLDDPRSPDAIGCGSKLDPPLQIAPRLLTAVGKGRFFFFPD